MASLTPQSGPNNGLALAIVASSSSPMVLFDGKLVVLAASTSFCRAFQIDPDTVASQPLAKLGFSERVLPKVASLLRATAIGHDAIEAYEIDFEPADGSMRRLVLNAQKLDPTEGGAVHVLLQINDVTDARHIEKVKEDLLREKGVLLQELQHRVANSLQIVASVLMQSARKVHSVETRGYLHDAHHRIMSVASLQRQLAITRHESVALRPYFTELCASIGASMIQDHNKVTLDVEIDDISVDPEVSVSLGLIVTELVINSLKHAFPHGRHGKIVVRFTGDCTYWKLTVSDDGAGMSPDDTTPKAGLGTSIVEALTAQLRCELSISSSSHGTEVLVSKPVLTAESVPELRAV